jgi:hypothetical protein
MKNSTFIFNDQTFKTSDKITCQINRTKITDAKIYIHNSYHLSGFKIRAYICQNLIAGAPCPDYLGYKYSWAFDIKDGKNESITMFNLKKYKTECFSDIISLAFPMRKI